MAYDIAELVESSFMLSHYSHIQPSEVDKLTTYEFRNYMRLMTEEIISHKEERQELMKALVLRRL